MISTGGSCMTRLNASHSSPAHEKRPCDARVGSNGSGKRTAPERRSIKASSAPMPAGAIEPDERRLARRTAARQSDQSSGRFLVRRRRGSHRKRTRTCRCQHAIANTDCYPCLERPAQRRGLAGSAPPGHGKQEAALSAMVLGQQHRLNFDRLGQREEVRTRRNPPAANVQRGTYPMSLRDAVAAWSSPEPFSPGGQPHTRHRERPYRRQQHDQEQLETLQP